MPFGSPTLNRMSSVINLAEEYGYNFECSCAGSKYVIESTVKKCRCIGSMNAKRHREYGTTITIFAPGFEIL